jgi:hypothetical protein
MNKRWVIGAIALQTGGCSATLREAASFRGDERPVRVSAEALGHAPSLPSDHELIGELGADCTWTEDRQTIEDEWLSDVDCSEARLTRAVEEAAAAHGADVLVGLDCYARLQSEAKGESRWMQRCTAQAARATGALTPRKALPTASAEPPASDAWRIRVDFLPRSPRVAGGRSQRGDLVRDVATLPVGRVPLGDVTACCRRGCSLDSVREGVRVAAGRIGASDVVSIHCIQRNDGWMCAGTAATFEVNPDVDARAR